MASVSDTFGATDDRLAASAALLDPDILPDKAESISRTR
jgi:hypothetical protein